MRTIIGRRNSDAARTDEPKNSCPKRNTMIAKGRVSSKGALDETSPSRFRPRRRFTNEPVLSPRRQAKPRNEPRINAVRPVPPTSNHAPDEPASGDANTVEPSLKTVPMPPLSTAATMTMQRSPEVIEPPISPFQVLPSPRMRFPSLQTLPPSIGQGPYPVLGNHLPHIIANVFAKKPGR